MTDAPSDAAQSRDVYLGIDTATPFLVIGLWSPQEGLLAGTIEFVERRHAARLVPALSDSLATAGKTRGHLAAVAAGTGPGSYTGLRVAGAVAKGICRGLDLPLRGCDTLAALAYAQLSDGEEGVALLDARRGNVYYGRYRRDGDSLLTLQPPSKAERQRVVASSSGAKLIEDGAPDPSFLARAALDRHEYRPSYL